MTQEYRAHVLPFTEKKTGLVESMRFVGADFLNLHPEERHMRSAHIS